MQLNDSMIIGPYYPSYEELFDFEINYTLLSRLFKSEITQDAKEALLGLKLSDYCDHPLISKGARWIDEAIRQEEPDNQLDLLAAEYAAAFIGTAGSKAAYPYESVYTSAQGLVMQKAYEQVRRIYRDHGLENQSDLYDDHIALELDYLAYLCRRAKNEKPASPEYMNFLRDQATFLEKHIFNWLPKFLKKIHENVDSCFYRGAAMMLEGTCQDHQRMLSWVQFDEACD
ncbi:TorD/DmsD family molecular chaperone [Turicimonas muris]|uniref:Molecular chaperone TorD n=1 Tax=Turicimonas muris TaxID=1796652 RepID=A0A227KI03_9BURK|nr:molecular chaperone TorD family protein [Turicimonas muris]ANU66953.1 hypothetical protein A4V04_11355 [Burkholderiales bacterium YL45]MBS4767872.1 molecular chaperone TorD family protein [Burkholderiales bacterium]OXE47581.1 hypothetical protein ADH67_07235 [Turicimonas muris]